MPQPDRLLRTIKTAILAFRNTPGRRGRFIQLQGATEVLIAGDMHGNLGNFIRLLERAQLKQHPQRHLVVQELVHGTYEYPTGGDKSHQMLDLLAALKCEYPKQVHMLLGNHELAQWTGSKISKGDREPLELFTLGVVTAYGKRAEEIYAAYLELFAVLPIAIRTPNRVFLSHSLPNAQRLDTFDLSVLERDKADDKEYRSGGSVHAIVWGRDTTPENVFAFLKKVDADLLISGHIPNEPGYETPNHWQLILDSMRTPAGCCLFPVTQPLTHDELVQHVEII
jgi:hypothetical protein